MKFTKILPIRPTRKSIEEDMGHVFTDEEWNRAKEILTKYNFSTSPLERMELILCCLREDNDVEEYISNRKNLLKKPFPRLIKKDE